MSSRAVRKERREAQPCAGPFFLHDRSMPKALDVVALLSSAAMMSRKAGTYSPETHVIDLAELRQIIFEMQHESEQEASGGSRARTIKEGREGLQSAGRDVSYANPRPSLPTNEGGREGRECRNTNLGPSC
jgi:hypothetical protein